MQSPGDDPGLFSCADASYEAILRNLAITAKLPQTFAIAET
jgi:hypothetical protein